MNPATNETRIRTAYRLGHNFVRTLAVFASFQLRAFGAEPIQGRIGGAADLVEILGRPIFAVHTEMPKCAASLFAVSGLAGHLNLLAPLRKSMLTPNWDRRRSNRPCESRYLEQA
jgi:hypothetical protein